MARIRPYTQEVSAQTGPIGARASAEDFGGRGADSAGPALGKGSDILYGVAARQEVSDVQAKLAEHRARETLALQQEAMQQDGTDPQFPDKYVEKLQERLAPIAENLSTLEARRAFETGSAELSAHILERAGAFQASLAGARARQNYLTTLDANRNTVLTDPTQFDNVLNSQIKMIMDRRGEYAALSPIDRENLVKSTRNELALSAVQGVIRMAPELAQKQLTEGRWDAYLDADKKNALLDHTQVAIRAREYEKERLERAQEKELEKQQEETRTFLVEKLAAGSLTTRDILNSNLKAVVKEHYLEVLRTRAREGENNRIKSRGPVFEKLVVDINRPYGDPQKITDPDVFTKLYADHKISFEDLQAARKEFFDARSPEGERLGQIKTRFLSGVKASITSSSGIKQDKQGDLAYSNYTYYVDQKIDEARRNNKNPADLFNPGSADYLGSEDTLSMFKRTTAQGIESVRDRYSPRAPALPETMIRKPGETIEQWRKRTGQ